MVGFGEGEATPAVLNFTILQPLCTRVPGSIQVLAHFQIHKSTKQNNCLCGSLGYFMYIFVLIFLEHSQKYFNDVKDKLCHKPKLLFNIEDKANHLILTPCRN